MYCTNCGEKLEPNAAFCTSCGTRVTGAEQQVRQSSGNPEQKPVQKKAGKWKKEKMTPPMGRAVQPEIYGFSDPMFAMDSPSSVPRRKKPVPAPVSEPQSVAADTAQTVIQAEENTPRQSGPSVAVSSGISAEDRNEGAGRTSAKSRKTGVIVGVAVLAVAAVSIPFIIGGSKGSSASVTTTYAVADTVAAETAVAAATEKEVEQATEESDLFKQNSTTAVEAETETVPEETTEATTFETTAEATTEETTTKEIRNGWVQENGKYYFYRDDKPVKGSFVSDGGSTYYMASDGSMSTGWVQANGKFYYADSSGRIKSNGWVSDGGDYYYVDKNGVMQTGWQQISGKWYYLGTSGKNRKEGWQTIDGQEYYFDGNGAMLADTVAPDGRRIDADGHPVKDDTLYAADTPDTLSGYYSFVTDEYELVFKFSADGTYQARRVFEDDESHFSGRYKCDPEKGLVQIRGSSLISSEPGYYDAEMMEVVDNEMGYVTLARG